MADEPRHLDLGDDAKGKGDIPSPPPAVKTIPLKDLNLADKEPQLPEDSPSAVKTRQVDPDQTREEARGDLARGLLYLLTFAIGGVLVFIGSGRLEGTVLTQSIFPSLIALAGTALGFYFGSQTNAGSASGRPAPSGTSPTPSRTGTGTTTR
jgi:hypothetical protein